MSEAVVPPPEVEALVERSHALGSDPRVTNYGGGNTSCKATVTDPVTGEPSEVLYVKGSGGDLGTLRHDGLATLRLHARCRRPGGFHHGLRGLIDYEPR